MASGNCACAYYYLTQSIVAHMIHRLHPGPLLPTVECRIGAVLALSGIRGSTQVCTSQYSFRIHTVPHAF
jgi:hypothetical protein